MKVTVCKVIVSIISRYQRRGSGKKGKNESKSLEGKLYQVSLFLTKSSLKTSPLFQISKLI